jgi:sensor histidine kinase regulating citrate/malate metabolism
MHVTLPTPRHRPQFARTTFSTPRLLDFCSEKELTAQTGHASDDWPLVIVKELADNSIDACEEAGILPAIEIKVDQDGIAISDNGPGLPARTIKSILDFAVRVSSREAYVSPTRGAHVLI